MTEERKPSIEVIMAEAKDAAWHDKTYSLPEVPPATCLKWKGPNEWIVTTSEGKRVFRTDRQLIDMLKELGYESRSREVH